MAHSLGVRVEVVTAVHAAYAGFVPAAWRSLNSQTHTDWRWIVQIDGPATDVLAALVTCGAADDHRVRWAANGSREGPAITRNVALGRTSAQLIQNLDADDELEPTALQQLCTALRTNPAAGFAVGAARDLLPSGTLIDHPCGIRPGIIARGQLVDNWITDPADYRLPVHPAGIMWRRELIVSIGGWTATHNMEDTGLLMAASALSPGILLDTTTLRYRRHRMQTSSKASSFRGGGSQIALIRSRAALLRHGPAWQPSSADTPPDREHTA
jgi:glycosyltransferase involved in cell wall biosynthesis